jgi:HEAT repeat protein
MAKPKPVPFSTLVAALLNDQEPFPPRFLHRFSDLLEEDAKSLAKVWSKISTPRRIALLEDLDELNQADDLVSFEEVCKLAIKDPEAQVRLLAVKMLREYELTQYIPDFIRMAQQDGVSDVRAAAASGLGVFIFLGEVDKISPPTLKRVEETLFGILQSQDESQVRQRALEALGYSSRPDFMPAIEQAYASDDSDWLISALNAMGRSADSKWKPRVVAMLDHPHPLVRAEAASAAGEIEIKSTVPALLKMLDDPDLDVRMAAIWALSQLGGKGVRKALETMLEATDDDDEANLLENALDNLDFTEDLSTIAMLNITGSGEEDEPLFDELDDLDDQGDPPA